MKLDVGHAINNHLIYLDPGDIVDRGPQAREAWNCLDSLQDTAPPGSKVVRILGNHEIWWLQGHFHMINRENDTRENVEHIVRDLKDRILRGTATAAYSHIAGNRKILFVHAGLRPAMLSYLRTKIEGELTPERIAEYMNNVLVRETSSCPAGLQRCPYADEIFEAGPDRY